MSELSANSRNTIFSEDRHYRYTLWREFNLTSSTYAQFIGLNPSTADEIQDDPTIRRCINFAKAWGHGALCMTNLFGYRATDPLDMKAYSYPVGDHNDSHIIEVASDAAIVICAWGVHGSHLRRSEALLNLLIGAGLRGKLHCLGTTKAGDPRHPLYLKGNSKPVSYP